LAQVVAATNRGGLQTCRGHTILHITSD